MKQLGTMNSWANKLEQQYWAKSKTTHGDHVRIMLLKRDPKPRKLKFVDLLGLTLWCLMGRECVRVCFGHRILKNGKERCSSYTKTYTVSYCVPRNVTWHLLVSWLRNKQGSVCFIERISLINILFLFLFSLWGMTWGTPKFQV